MATVLLDHPWKIVDAMNPKSEAFEALEKFDAFFKARSGLQSVPFIDLDQYFELCKVIENDAERRSTATYFKIIVQSYVRWTTVEPEVTASPNPEPKGIALPPSWCCALGSALFDPQDWRNPQILVCKKNSDRWSNTKEISIKLYNNTNEDRVLAIIEDYDSHPFAIPDFDPWDLRKYDPIPLGNCNPCRLPKPPRIDDSSLAKIRNSLEAIRQKGWRVGERYFYIPPANWDPNGIAKVQWRNGRGFPQQQGPGMKGPRVVDYQDRIWVWDHTETQWDVQQGDSYYRISEVGALLPRSPLR
jgi:hypothetical protein